MRSMLLVKRLVTYNASDSSIESTASYRNPNCSTLARYIFVLAYLCQLTKINVLPLTIHPMCNRRP